MGTAYTAIRIPSHSKAFVFGSVLHSSEPNDFDLLVVYDSNLCPPVEAYERHSSICSDISALFDLPVHLTLLTQSEESNVHFIGRTSAIPLDDALKIIWDK